MTHVESGGNKKTSEEEELATQSPYKGEGR